MVSGSWPISDKWVIRLYVYFATLPDADCIIFRNEAAARGGVAFKVADSKLYPAYGNIVFGSTGVAVTTGQWYRIDFMADNSANPTLIDVSIEGTACAQLSSAVAADSTQQFRAGLGNVVTAGDAYFDDIVVSHTLVDYPIGAGKVDHFVPVSDGAPDHNIAGAADFRRGGFGRA